MSSDFLDLFNSIVSEEAESIEDNKSMKEFDQFKSKNDYQALTLKSLKKKRFDDNTRLRKTLSKWAFVILSVWILFVMIVLLFNETIFCISDNVLITLLSTSTIKIIGIVLIVMKDIFNGKSENNMENIE
mgnify:CR=1 FL=1